MVNNKFCLQAILLIDCSYSNALSKLFSKQNIKADITNVSFDNKEKYKTDKIQTFPQVYFSDKLIGGYDIMNQLYTIVKNKNDLDKILNSFNEILVGWDKKSILLLIECLI